MLASGHQLFHHKKKNHKYRCSNNWSFVIKFLLSKFYYYYYYYYNGKSRLEFNNITTTVYNSPQHIVHTCFIRLGCIHPHQWHNLAVSHSPLLLFSHCKAQFRVWHPKTMAVWLYDYVSALFWRMPMADSASVVCVFLSYVPVTTHVSLWWVLTVLIIKMMIKSYNA